MINKKNEKSQAPKKDDTGEVKSEAADAQAQAGKEPGVEAGTAGEAATEENSSQQKEISETDVLKMYLEQSLGEIKRLRAELETQKKEAEDEKSQALQYKEKLNSVVSEYENFRRRTAQEKEGMFSEAVAKSVATLLPALDSLERAIQFSASNTVSYKQGVEMTLKQLCDGFKSLGVTEIEAQGAAFNPDMHNAVMHVEDEAQGDSVVTEVFQKGYAIGERVIRHSVVKVAN